MVSVQEIEEMMSKLNPLAREFTPERHGHRHGYSHIPQPQGHWQGRARGHGHRGRASVVPSREDVVKRTVFVSDIDHLITEEHLASLFIHCGRVVDCRICGDPKSLRRFAFIEFTHQSAARAALSLSGTMLGFYPLKVLPSKTAIAPVNPTFLPQSPHERDMCARTIYCTNIDKKICQTDLRIFFESVCGQVDRLRMLGDYRHSTRIAFVEFVMAESATAALNCSGVVLGSSAIRVSPSKTPVRSTRKLVHSRTVKQSMH